MAFRLTYNDLVQQIMNYLERSDAATQATIPMFILLAQDRIAKDSKTLGVETYTTGNLTDGESMLEKPNDWQNTISFNITVNQQSQPVLIRTYDYCQLFINSDQGQLASGVPQYVADYGYDFWYMVPTPNQAYPFQISYMSYIQPIDVNTPTNWLTNYAPEVLFYGCMMEAMIFLKNVEMIQYWQGLYQTALAAINKEDQERYQDRFSDRTKD